MYADKFVAKRGGHRRQTSDDQRSIVKEEWIVLEPIIQMWSTCLFSV